MAYTKAWILCVQIDLWLGNLLVERSEDIYRMKGILSVDGMPERFVFQVSFCALSLLHLISLFFCFLLYLTRCS